MTTTPTPTDSSLQAAYARVRNSIEDQGHGRWCGKRERKDCDCDLAPVLAALNHLNAAAQGGAR
ncbi:hypothetical protein QEG98_28000 [Myxococcus sp. MxC21-1]|uniref:hypothetical protein n=1 Tax=Myxococcus sp. MxC21-1 TaxID=3041439 RepID=UPI002931DC9F|nr:hypothetical protein [Myxococcus sp. MxC21-1]WNZ59848.1 hypothetical protein QEG98_28000 [Myxococcus sp. MxC21-1]